MNEAALLRAHGLDPDALPTSPGWGSPFDTLELDEADPDVELYRRRLARARDRMSIDDALERLELDEVAGLEGR